MHGALVLPIGEELPEGDAERVGGSLQPVPRMGVWAADQFEAAIRRHIQVLAEKCVHRGATPGCVPVFDRGNGKVARTAAVTVNAIGVGTVDRTTDVHGIGVVTALFANGVEIMQQLRTQRVVILQEELHAQTNVLCQAAEAGSTAQVASRNTGAEGQASSGLQLITELMPGLGEHLVFAACVVHGHDACSRVRLFKVRSIRLRRYRAE